MLVLSRKNRESVIVGRAESTERMLTVTVLEISGDRVSLGFDGGEDIPVHRSEVWARIRAEDQAAKNERTT